MKTDYTILAASEIDVLRELVCASRQSPVANQPELDVLEEVLLSSEAMSPELMSPDVIRMNSLFRVLDLDSGRRKRYKLVLPANADIARGRISVLAPVGTAVLGRRQGDVVEAKTPGGSRRLRIEHVSQTPAPARRIRSGQLLRPPSESEGRLHGHAAA